MTSSLAQQIFFALYEAIEQNGLQDIGTELLSNSVNNEVGSNNSIIALQELYEKAEDPEEALTALKELSKAVETYFERSTNLVKLFNEELDYFPKQSTGMSASNNLLLFHNDEVINIADKLDNSNVTKIISLTSAISEYANRNDNDFFNILNREF